MLLKTSKSVTTAVADVADTEETLAAEEAVEDTEETLAVHAMAAVTEEVVMAVHVTVADIKAQTHVAIAEAEMHVLQEVMVYHEVTEASVALFLKKAAHQVHAMVADTKATVIAAIADHHAHQEPIDQALHAVTQVARQKPLLVTLTKKTNFKKLA